MGNKTKENNTSVINFLNTIENELKRIDCFTLLEFITRLSGEEPKMWGDKIIGFGKYHFKYKSGREGDWMRLGFSPRKKSITIYFLSGLNQYNDLLRDLGKHKIGKSCLYVNKLSEINIEKLGEIIIASLDYMKKRYPL